MRVSSRAAESLEASSGAAAAVGLRRPGRPLPLPARRPALSAACAVGESAGHGHSGTSVCAPWPSPAAAAVGAALRRRRRVPGQRSGGPDSAARRLSASVRAVAATAAPP